LPASPLPGPRQQFAPFCGRTETKPCVKNIPTKDVPNFPYIPNPKFVYHALLTDTKIFKFGIYIPVGNTGWLMATQSGGWYGTTCTLFFVQFISRLQNLATANVFLGEIHITKDSENPK